MRVFPDRLPFVCEHIAKHAVIICLAGDHVPVGFGTHIVEGSRAAFDTQVQPFGVEVAVLGGCVPDQLLFVGLCFLLRQQKEGRQNGFIQAAADVLALAGVDEGVQADGGHTQLGQKIKGLGEGIDIVIEHGGIGHHVQFGYGDDVAHPGHGLLPRALGTDHTVMDTSIVRFEGDLDVVQTGINKLLDVCCITKPASVGVDAGDLAFALGIGDQFWQVFPQGGFATGEDNVRDAVVPQPVDDLFPLGSVQLGIIAQAGVVTVGAVVVAAVGQRQVHAVRGGELCGKGFNEIGERFV